MARSNTGGLVNTVVFSRKNTSSGPDDMRGKASPTKKQLADLNPNPLASIVHQTDRNGKQHSTTTLTTGRSASSRRIGRDDRPEPTSGGSFRNLFANIWSALGISEQQMQRNHRNSPVKSKSAKNVVELRRSVIPPQYPQDMGKKCLVLDLDETLVHSSFKPTQNPDYIIPVDIEGTIHQVYVCKRPGVDEFLRELGKVYEIVIYTASLSKYADPLLDRLDPENVIRFRLFREHCVQYEGNYVKDLSLLDRDISQTIIIDNSPMSYLFHPRNAIGCSSFIDDMSDRELESIQRFLFVIEKAEDVRSHLHTWDASY